MPKSPYTAARPSARKHRPKPPKPLGTCDNCNEPAATKYNLSTALNLCPKCIARWRAGRASRAAQGTRGQR